MLGAQVLGQWPDPALEGVTLIGEGHLGPLGAQRLGDAPGNGVVIRHPHDQPALAPHHPRHERYPRYRLIARVQLVPPKPKLFEITVSSPALSIRLVTTGASANSGSISSTLALAAMKSPCIISMQ